MDNNEILLNRTVYDSFTFAAQNPNYLKWWIDLLFSANHEEVIAFAGGSHSPLRRGVIITSYSTLASRWNVSTRSVERFMDIMKRERKIVLTHIRKATIITIVNYGEYVVSRNKNKED